jgi:hypothetical protein
MRNGEDTALCVWAFASRARCQNTVEDVGGKDGRTMLKYVRARYQYVDAG